MLRCSSRPRKLTTRGTQTSSGWSLTRNLWQTASRPPKRSCLDLSFTPNTTPFRPASCSCAWKDAGHAQSSRPTSCKAYRSCTRTCCSAQQQHSSDQHTNTDQQQGPDISLLSPVLQRQWHSAKNVHHGNILIKPHTHRKVWWSCDQCPDGHPHVWEATVSPRSNGTSCPFCNNNRVCQHNSLATKRPDIALEFSDRNQGTAHEYTAASRKAVFWRCRYGHEYAAAINNRTTNNRGCPECFAARNSQPKQKHPVLADSTHAMLQYWDAELNAKEGLNLNKVRCRSGRVCNWVCHSCPKGRLHRWRAQPGTLYKGHGCPCCSGRKACICNSLQSLFPDVAAEWDYTRNTGTPADYTASSNSKVWWCSDRQGSFQARIDTRTYIRKQLLDA